MKHRIKALLGIVALTTLAIGAGPKALAHHSFAMFTRKQVSMKGIVRRLEWSNPHTYLYVEVSKKGGSAELWTIECSSPNELNHWGWRYGMVRVGEAVTIVMFPLRNGARGGLLYSITLPNGKLLKAN